MRFTRELGGDEIGRYSARIVGNATSHVEIGREVSQFSPTLQIALAKFYDT